MPIVIEVNIKYTKYIKTPCLCVWTCKIFLSLREVIIFAQVINLIGQGSIFVALIYRSVLLVKFLVKDSTHLFLATASYRLLPEITIVKPCEEELAEKLAACFPEGVITVEKKKGI